MKSYLLTGVLAATGATVLMVTTEEGDSPTGASLDPRVGGGNLSYVDTAAGATTATPPGAMY